MKKSKKMTLAAIKNLIDQKAAIEIKKEDVILKRNLTQVGFSTGTSGVTGGLWKHDRTNKLYAIAGRTSLLFYYL